MNRLYKFLILVPGVLLLACTTKPKQQPQQEERDSVTVVMSDHPITNRLYAELDSSEVYDDSILYGYWFKPHEASAVNIFFHKDNTFEFKYYIVQNDTTIIDVVKKGTFTIGEADVNKTRVITLVADDGWNDGVFNGKIKYKSNRTHYYLEDKESGLYLVKGSD